MLTRLEFSKLLQRVSGAWHRGDFEEALAELEKIIANVTPEMKAQCLFNRGMIRQDQGAPAAARQDWTEGLQCAPPGTYLRFLLQYHLGEASEQEGRPEEALAWYQTALKTCSEGDEFSGHQALTAWLRLSGERIEPGDEPLLASVSEKSWRVLELPGAPNPENLPATIAELTASFARRVEQIVNES